MIVGRQITKSFGPRQVLRGLDFNVSPGVVTLLLGSNGAGKTTLLRIVTGLCEPDAGSVTVGGLDALARPLEARARIAFLPQAPRFHPRLTTRQVGRYYGRLRGRTSAEVDAALDAWGLSGHGDLVTADLSGGLRQRLAIAIFALAEAPVLVLDEPGLSLDPEWRAALQRFLREAAKRGATVLVATHLLGEWERKANAAIYLEDGRVASPPASARRDELSPEPEGSVRL